MMTEPGYYAVAISSCGYCLQVGRYGGLEEEVEHLKRDKNVLMLELVRLRQQQQVRSNSADFCMPQP